MDQALLQKNNSVAPITNSTERLLTYFTSFRTINITCSPLYSFIVLYVIDWYAEIGI
jgi:hypothetical protein